MTDTISLTLNAPASYSGAQLIFFESFNIQLTKIVELGSQVILESDDYGIRQYNTIPFQSFPIKKIKIDKKYITITPKYIINLGGNVTNNNDNIISFTDVFYFYPNIQNIPYASLFLDSNNVLSAYFITSSQYVALSSSNGIQFNVPNDNKIIVNVPEPKLNPITTILSIPTSHLSTSPLYLIFFEGECIKLTNDKNIATNVALVNEIVNDGDFATDTVQKIVINKKNITICQQVNGVVNTNDNIITLTDPFYYFDSVDWERLYASLFLKQKQDGTSFLYAFFNTDNAFLAQGSILFNNNSSSNVLLQIVPVTE